MQSEPRPARSLKRVIVTLAAVGAGIACVAVVMFLVSSLRERAEQEAIARVIDQNKAVFDSFKGKAKSAAELGGLAGELGAIDLSDCPEDFRERYKAAVRALDQVGMKAMATLFDKSAPMDARKVAEDEKAANEAVKNFQDAIR
jgi:hypothetical protein